MILCRDERRQLLIEKIKKRKQIEKFREKRKSKKKVKEAVHPNLTVLGMLIYLN